MISRIEESMDFLYIATEPDFAARKLRRFAAVLYLVAAASLSACAMAPSAPTEMPTGAATAQPIGAMLFCKVHAGECADKARATTRVEMTDQRLEQLRAVQYAVNRRIDPTGAVAVAWHYAVNGNGTCVQYAMEKRRQLIALGWPASSLELATATMRQGEGHLV